MAPVDASLYTTVISMIREYMSRRQATIAKYVAGRPIYELFKGLERMEGYIRFLSG